MPLMIEGSNIYHTNQSCPKLTRADKPVTMILCTDGMQLCSWCKSDNKNEQPEVVKTAFRQLARYKYGTITAREGGFQVTVPGQATLVIGRSGSLHFMSEGT